MPLDAEADERARGFAEGIEAALNWHQAEGKRLAAIAETERLEGRFVECTETFNQALEHVRSIPAIRALASARADQ
jgi:hypothetical protein